MTDDHGKTEDELFQQLGNDPDIRKAVEHHNTVCEQQEEADGCMICTGLHALEVLEHVSDELKAPAFVKKISNPPAILLAMQKLSIWFAEATSDFLEFIDDNSDHDHDEDEEDDYHG